MNAHSDHGYDAIYLSPHLDDVALSCGGQVFQQTQAGARLLIVTVMAGDPPAAVSGYALSLHERWAVEEATAARRAEDLAACRILGDEPLHWPIPDCIYRYHPLTGAPFYLSDEDLFGEVDPAEAGLAAELAERLAALPPHRRLIAPLAVGNHVDHQLVRQAAELAYGPERLLYYEDYPYAQLPGKLAQVVGDGSGWQAELIRLTPDALAAKFEAVAAFRSQLSTFFSDRADLEAQIGGYAAATGGERLWRRATASEDQVASQRHRGSPT